MPPAPAANPDDVDRVHHGCLAARVFQRRRFGNASCDGRGRIWRHAGRDLLRPVPDTGVLRPAAFAGPALREKENHRDRCRATGGNRVMSKLAEYDIAKRVAPLLAGLLLVACGTVPELKAPQLDVPAVFKEAAEPMQAADGSRWKVAQPAESQARGAWWLAFNDPALTRLIDEATQANASLAVAAARVKQAR